MSLAPDMTEMLARARADLRMGVPVILEGAQTTIVASAETLDTTRFTDLLGLGEPYLAITQRRAETLKARAYDGDIARVELQSDSKLDWVLSIADPADDLNFPLKGPLVTLRGGDAAPGQAAVILCKEAHLLPAAVCVPVEAASPHIVGLTRVPVSEVIDLAQAANTLKHVIQARVPLAVSEAGRLHVFRPDDGGDDHYAVEIGKPDRSRPVLARLHSACFTGDLLGSLKCDCGPQLRGALAQMGDAGAGVLLYLNQEGRGIGLANKMRAYALQDQGFDTVEANHRLGFEDDERDFRLGAEILRQMGFSSVRLLTNNPAKVAMMESCGIAVAERVPLRVGENPLNREYLATKARKSGHIL